MASASETSIIDLAIPCQLPFGGVEHMSPAKSGVVELERRNDDLYLYVRYGRWFGDSGGGLVVSGRHRDPSASVRVRRKLGALD